MARLRLTSKALKTRAVVPMYPPPPDSAPGRPLKPFPNCQSCGDRGDIVLPDKRVLCGNCFRAEVTELNKEFC